MSNQEILYVAYKDEPLEAGVSYATYLSNLLGEKLRIVLLNRKGLGERFDDLAAAVTFAEANEHETAREFISGGGNGKAAAALQQELIEKCDGDGVQATVHIGLEATVAVIMNFLKQKKVDLVLLSPSVTTSRSILKKLVKFSPRPVVTMARGAGYTQS